MIKKQTLEENSDYKTKDEFTHDTLGIKIIVGRDVSDEDANLVVDKLIGIKRIFEEKRIEFDLSQAFNTLVIIASKEERKILSPFGNNNWDGFYRRSQDLIVIDVIKSKSGSSQKSGNYDYLDYVLVHEIGHAIHLKYIDQSSRNQYDNVTKIFLNQISLRERIIKKINSFNIGILEVALGSDSQVKNFIKKNKTNKDFYEKVKCAYKNFKPARSAETFVYTHLVYDLKLEDLEEEYFEELAFWEFNEQMIPLNTNYFFNNMKTRFNYLLYKAESTMDELVELFNNLFESSSYKKHYNSLKNLRIILDNVRIYYLQDDEEAKKKAESLLWPNYSVEDYFFNMPDEHTDEILGAGDEIKKTKEFKDLVDYFAKLDKNEKFDNNEFYYHAREVLEEIDPKVVNEFIVDKEIEDLSKTERDSLDIENILPKNLLVLYKEKYQINEKQYRPRARDSDKFKDLKVSTLAIRDLMPTVYGLKNHKEDFAENFSLFVLNPDTLAQWNINRLIKLMTQTRVQGKTVMKAHKNILLVKKYVKMLIEDSCI